MHIVWFVFFLLHAQISDEHDLYISVLEVEHDLASENAQVRIKVFTDDLESALRNTFDQPFNLLDPGQCSLYMEKLSDYFSRHVSLDIDGSMAELELQNCQKEYETTWLIFYIDCEKDWEAVTIKATHFMELFPTQSNVIRIRHGEEKRFFLLSQKKKENRSTF